MYGFLIVISPYMMQTRVCEQHLNSTILTLVTLNVYVVNIKTILAGFRPLGTHSSYSAETIPSAPLELSENHYTPNVIHLVAGTRDTCQGGSTKALQYGQGPSHGM